MSAPWGWGADVEIPYRVSADLTGHVYVSLDGWLDDDRFDWSRPA